MANVLGVTTDTISRWENNRYPTIKRENAEKLAQAIEVELAEILRKEESETPAHEVSLPDGSRHRRRQVLISALLALLLSVAFVWVRQMGAVPMAERRLPGFGAPNEVIPVQLRISRKDAATGLIVKERLPADWRFLSSLPPAASSQAASGEVKWLIPPGSGPLRISYSVRISPAAVLKSTAAFTGEVLAPVGGITRGRSCGGDRSLTVDGVHWADRNGDGRIDDDEIMPAYYLTEEMKGLGLDWKIIEAIWSGRGYRWDPAGEAFTVVR